MISCVQLFVLLAAGVGGIAPNLVDLAQIWTGKAPWIPEPIYYVGLSIFFALGSAVAFIFSETDRRKAFFLGMSLPALVAAAQTQLGDRIQSEDVPIQEASLFQIIQTAYAQESDTDNVQPGQATHSATGISDDASLELNSETDCPKCAVWLYDQNGKFLEKQPFPDADKIYTFSIPKETPKFGIWNEQPNPEVWNLPPDGEKIYTFSIPKETSKFGIWNEQINPKIWNLPPDGEATWSYEFQYKRNLWNDLRRGLGNYNVKPYDLNLVPK